VPKIDSGVEAGGTGLRLDETETRKNENETGK
jgi:hypothetical protein